MIWIMLAGEAFSSSVAVAPKRSGKIASPPRPKVKASGGEPTKTSFWRDVQHFARIAIGDDQQIAVEMHGRLRLAGRAGGEAEQRDIVAAGLHRVELHRLVERDAVEFGVVVGGAVETDDLLEELAGLGAGDQFVGDAAVAERQRDLGLVDDLAEFAGAQHRHGVDHDRAGLGGGKPGRDQRRIVAGADQHAMARLDAVVLDQRMREPVRPVGQFLVGAAAAIADQRNAVAKAALDHAVGQFDRGVEMFRILEFRPVEQKLRPLLERRQVVARERIDMRGRAER